MVSIITVNFHSEEDILESLSSIVKHSKSAFEYIVVSNSDVHEDFRQKLESISNNVKIIETGSNLGFAKACNIGAKNSVYDYIFFLNPDTRFTNDVLEQLLTCINSLDNPGVIGPLTLDENKKPYHSVKNYFSPVYLLHLGLPLLSFVLPANKKGGHRLLPESGRADVLNGHAMFIKKRLFDELGGLNEQFFMYWEENDLCLRSELHGYKNYFCKEAQLIHLSGTSTSPYFLKMEIEKHKSQKIFIETFYPSYSFINRIAGISGYLTRLFGALVTFRKKKIDQFWTLLKWYTFTYK